MAQSMNYGNYQHLIAQTNYGNQAGNFQLIPGSQSGNIQVVPGQYTTPIAFPFEMPPITYPVLRAYLIRQGVRSGDALSMSEVDVKTMVSAFRKLETAACVDTEIVYAMMEQSDGD